MECAILAKDTDRKIDALWFPGSDGTDKIKVGAYSVKSIKPIRVAGQGGWVPWFEVTFFDTDEIQKFNASFVQSVQYMAGEQ